MPKWRNISLFLDIFYIFGTRFATLSATTFNDNN